MNTAVLLGELTLAVGILGFIVWGLIDQVQELRLLATRSSTVSAKPSTRSTV